MKVYPPRDIRPFVMYCVNGKPRSSLLIESTDSMILHSITYNTIYRPIYIYKGCYTVIYKTLKTIESLALHERLPKLLTVLLYIPILHSFTYNTIYRPIYIHKGCYTVIYKTLKTIESLALHERLPKLLTVLLYSYITLHYIQ